MGRTSDWVMWKPKTVGDYSMTLSVPPNSEETIKENNRITAPISIREEKLRVLVIESLPRWEYRYLRNALSRDPGVEVSCLLFHPGLSKPGGGNKDYIKQFPAGLELDDPLDQAALLAGELAVADPDVAQEDHVVLGQLVQARGELLDVVLIAAAGLAQSRVEEQARHLHARVAREGVAKVAVLPAGIRLD